MAPRLELQELLKDILGSDHVYFQPPATVTMQYPCIVYQRDFRSTQHADGIPYHSMKRYQVIVIDRNPDSAVCDEIAKLPLCSYDRFYTAENLNHDVFNLFF